MNNWSKKTLTICRTSFMCSKKQMKKLESIYYELYVSVFYGNEEKFPQEEPKYLAVLIFYKA